jgi:prepilin-type N-terminal cleavage/methylation domain-containing protein
MDKLKEVHMHVKWYRAHAGFTLLELLFVVIIIGILATIAIPQYSSFAERAAGAQAAFQLTEIRNREIWYRGNPDEGGGTTYGTLNKIGLEPSQPEWVYGIYNGTTAATASDLATTTGLDVRAQRSKIIGSEPAAREIRVDLDTGAICVYDANTSNNIYKVGKDAASDGTNCSPTSS